MRVHKHAVAALAATMTALALSGLGFTHQAPAAVRACSAGLVVLTFDDGPSTNVTPTLLEVLRNRRVPATFFVVGQRVAAAPWITRRTDAYGFTVANHSYRHEQLTTLGNAAIASTLRSTRRAILNAGASPSPLMRPPYGSIDARVRAVVADVGMVPVLWTVDPRDWERQSGASIASRTLAQLRPDKRNVVLLHDGIVNSPNTLRAVPTIVRVARERGYCFADLDRSGRPAPPVPRVGVSDATVTERDGTASSLRFTLSLDRPTSRVTAVGFRTHSGTATSGSDFTARDVRVRFPAGVTRMAVTVPVRGDSLDEPTERMRVALVSGSLLRIGDATGRGTILDNDPPPALRLSDAEVQEPVTGTSDATVTVRLSRPSGRPIAVRLATRPGTATAADYRPVDVTLRFPPGRTTARVAVPVLADTRVEPVERFRLVVVSSSNLTVADGVAALSINPPVDPAPAPSAPVTAP